MDNMTIEQLYKTYDNGVSMRRNWDRIWDEIAYYVLPSKTGFLTTFVPGERTRWSRRFDTTAGHANKTLANHLHMAMCSPAQPWFELYFKDEMLNEDKEAKMWAEDTTHRMFSAYNYSNFNAQVNTMFQNLCAFGTACFQVQFINNPRDGFSLVFDNVKLSQAVFDVNEHYKIDTVFHEYKLTQRQAKLKFDKDFPTTPENINNKVSLLKVTRPNPEYDPTSMNPKKRAFLCQWLHNKEEFAREYYYELPYMTVRYDEIDQDDVYGEGPGILALSDVRTVNQAKRLEMRGWEKGIDPPLVGAAGGIIGDLHIEAGGYTQVRDPRMIGELPGRMDINITQIKGEEIRDQIRKAYKIDQLMLPERENQNPLTAYEISKRYEQMQKMMGATVGRIESELLKPLINRTVGIMHRNGQLMDAPEHVMASMAQLDVKYVGPLAKSQVSNDLVAIERLLQMEMAIAQVDPNALMVVDHLAAMRTAADRLNAPAEVIRSEKEVQEIQEAQQQAQANQQAQESDMADAQIDQANSQADMADVELLKQIQGGLR